MTTTDIVTPLAGDGDSINLTDGTSAHLTVVRSDMGEVWTLVRSDGDGSALGAVTTYVEGPALAGDAIPVLVTYLADELGV